jgi:hypothetical protein
MASDMKAHTQQMCVTEFLHAEKVTPVDIQRRLLNVYGDQTVDDGGHWLKCETWGNEHQN